MDLYQYSDIIDGSVEDLIGPGSEYNLSLVDKMEVTRSLVQPTNT